MSSCPIVLNLWEPLGARVEMHSSREDLCLLLSSTQRDGNPGPCSVFPPTEDRHRTPYTTHTVLCVSSLPRWRNGDKARLCNLSRVPQIVCGRAGLWTQGVSMPGPWCQSLSHSAMMHLPFTVGKITPQATEGLVCCITFPAEAEEIAFLLASCLSPFELL